MDGQAGVTKLYNEKYLEGTEYQDFIAKYFNLVCFTSRKYQYEYGENTLGMEIKYDHRFEETFNIYIETHEKTNKDNMNFIESGILRDNNTWLWLIGNYKMAFIFAIKTLRRFLENDTMREKVSWKETPTSKGFILTLDQANQVCIHKLYFTRVTGTGLPTS